MERFLSFSHLTAHLNSRYLSQYSLRFIRFFMSFTPIDLTFKLHKYIVEIVRTDKKIFYTTTHFHKIFIMLIFQLQYVVPITKYQEEENKKNWR